MREKTPKINQLDSTAKSLFVFSNKMWLDVTVWPFESKRPIWFVCIVLARISQIDIMVIGRFYEVLLLFLYVFAIDAEWFLVIFWYLPMGVDLNARSSDKSVVAATGELFIDADCACATKRMHASIKLNMVDLLTLIIGFIVVNCLDWNVFGKLCLLLRCICLTHALSYPYHTQQKHE